MYLEIDVYPLAYQYGTAVTGVWTGPALTE